MIEVMLEACLSYLNGFYAYCLISWYIYIYMRLSLVEKQKKKKKFVDDLGKWIKLDSVFDLQKNL